MWNLWALQTLTKFKNFWSLQSLQNLKMYEIDLFSQSAEDYNWKVKCTTTATATAKTTIKELEVAHTEKEYLRAIWIIKGREGPKQRWSKFWKLSNDFNLLSIEGKSLQISYEHKLKSTLF